MSDEMKQQLMKWCLDGMMILHLVAHPIDLLDVGEDHFGVDSGVSDHGVHILGSQEVGNACVPLSSLEGDFVVLSSVFWVDF